MGHPSTPQSPQHAGNRRRAHIWLLFIPILCYLLSSRLLPSQLIPNALAPPTSFPELTPHCDHVPPISAASYHARQNALAKVLHELGAAAYIVEPSASAVYYLNVSETKWKLSERPLLFVITPYVSALSQVEARLSILTPKFEAARARLLPVPLLPSPEPNTTQINYIEWAEEDDPYAVLFDRLHLPSNLSTSESSSPTTVLIDGATRLFIADGLQRTLGRSGGKAAITPGEVTTLRERKTPEEIEILKCVNEATLLAIRATHKRMYIGMRESVAREMASQALKAVGLENAGCLTLFGENAALPHGSGTDRRLRKEDFALFDCGGQRHDYWSDVTRTVALEESSIPEDHLKIWQHVQTAQSIALVSARPGVLTSQVDSAARAFLTAVGYGNAFTHRLGHGIGLEVHESPYLRGGSDAIPIQTGHTFSDEPGVYIEGKVGVRLEDCFFVGSQFISTYLTAGVGGPAQSPWKP